MSYKRLTEGDEYHYLYNYYIFHIFRLKSNNFVCFGQFFSRYFSI